MSRSGQPPPPSEKSRLASAEAPERLFNRAFRELRPRSDAPEFAVRFRPFANVRSRIRYDHETGRVTAELSDLLVGAPPEVTRSLAVALIGKLYEVPVPARSREPFSRWVYSPATQRAMLRARRERGRKRLLPARGSTRNLQAAFRKINRLHFDGALAEPRLGWNPDPQGRQLGHWDPAHETIVINPALDSPEVPELALEFVLFHEMLHLKHPVELRRHGRCVHTAEFRKEERSFPRYREARRLLRSLQSPDGKLAASRKRQERPR